MSFYVRSCLFPVLWAVFVVVAFSLLLPTVGCADSCVTAACHPGLIKKSKVHEPAVDNCLSCHQRKIEAHPVDGKKSFALVARVWPCAPNVTMKRW